MARGTTASASGSGSSATLKPQRPAASLPASSPSRRQSCKVILPLPLPAEMLAWVAAPGRKHSAASSQAILPPDCECRCTAGLKPPDIASKSQLMAIVFFTVAAGSPFHCAILAPLMRPRPATSVTI